MLRSKSSRSGMSATGVYRANGEFRGINSYLAALMAPELVENPSIPDNSLRRSVGKHVTWNKTYTVPSGTATTGMVVVDFNSPRVTFRLYGYDPTTQTMNPVAVLDPSEDLSENYRWLRPVCGICRVISATTSGTSIAIGGQFTAISYQDKPDLRYISADTMLKYASSNNDALNYAKVEDGMVGLMMPSEDKSFRLPETDVTRSYSSTLATYSSFFTDPTAWNLDPGTSITVFDTNLQPTLIPPNLRGHFTIKMTIPWKKTANTAASVIYGYLRVTYRKGDTTTYARLLPAENRVYGMPTCDSMNRISLQVEEDFYSDLAEVERIEFKMESDSDLIACAPSGDYYATFRLESSSMYQNGQDGPGVILHWSSLEAGQLVRISGRQHFEAVPTAALAAQVRTDFTPPDVGFSLEATESALKAHPDLFRAVFSGKDYDARLGAILANAGNQQTLAASGILDTIKGVANGVGHMAVDGIAGLAHTGVDVLTASGERTTSSFRASGKFKCSGRVGDDSMEARMRRLEEQLMQLANENSALKRDNQRLSQGNLTGATKPILIPGASVAGLARVSVAKLSRPLSTTDPDKANRLASRLDGLVALADYLNKKYGCVISRALFPVVGLDGIAHPVALYASDMPLQGVKHTSNYKHVVAGSTHVFVDELLGNGAQAEIIQAVTLCQERGLSFLYGDRVFFSVDFENQIATKVANGGDIDGPSVGFAALSAALGLPTGPLLTGSLLTDYVIEDLPAKFEKAVEIDTLLLATSHNMEGELAAIRQKHDATIVSAQQMMFGGDFKPDVVTCENSEQLIFVICNYKGVSFTDVGKVQRLEKGFKPTNALNTEQERAARARLKQDQYKLVVLGETSMIKLEDLFGSDDPDPETVMAVFQKEGLWDAVGDGQNQLMVKAGKGRWQDVVNVYGQAKSRVGGKGLGPTQKRRETRQNSLAAKLSKKHSAQASKVSFIDRPKLADDFDDMSDDD